MKRFASLLRVLSVLFALCALGVMQTASAGKQDFTLVNATGVEIQSVYMAPHDSDDWGDDILDEDTLANGSSVDISFSRKEKAKMWDLRVEDSDGNSLEWENLDLLEISQVTLHYKKGKTWADVE